VPNSLKSMSYELGSTQSCGPSTTLRDRVEANCER
jgi:hypothetical protein